MSAQGVAVERFARDTTDFVSAAPAGGASRAAGPFLYPSGARPLAGYTIKRGVGQGGFGEIYYAVSDAGKEVALKLVRRNLDVELRGMRQCLNLRHPNLLDLYDIRQDDGGDTWIVMEYVAGQGLQDALIAHPDGLSPGEAMQWFQGIAAGVAYLHDRGIVHRDLKPGNIFCDEGVVKVGDYGLSKFISCSRRSGHTESVGTVHYMAPEVANGRYGKEIDIYALGVVLYEMLTGRVPFDGESVGEVLMKHLTAQPDVSMLAEPYRSAVARALEKDPERRFRSVGEMVSAVCGARARPAFGVGPQSAADRPVGSATTSASDGPAPRPVLFIGTAGPEPPGAPPPIPPETRSVAQPLVQAELVNEEPIWRAVRRAWRQFCDGWNHSNIPTPLRIVLILLGVFVLLTTARISLPLALVLLVAYGAYRVVRMIVLALMGPQQPTAMPAAQVAAVAMRAPAPPRARRELEPSLPAIVLKSPRERVTDLIGSLLVGALAAMATCLVMVLISSFYDSVPPLGICAWLVLAGIAGTWTVLVLAKFWEYSQGDPLLRRIILMLAGMGLGLLAWLAAQFFLVDFPQDHGLRADYYLPPGVYDGRHQPLWPAYVAVFGAMLASLRWWRQADPLRASRLRLWPMLVSVAMAGIVAGLLKFPQPWLMMVAGIMSVSVQLAGTWAPPSQRLRPQRKMTV